MGHVVRQQPESQFALGQGGLRRLQARDVGIHFDHGGWLACPLLKEGPDSGDDDLRPIVSGLREFPGPLPFGHDLRMDVLHRDRRPAFQEIVAEPADGLIRGPPVQLLISLAPRQHPTIQRPGHQWGEIHEFGLRREPLGLLLRARVPDDQDGSGADQHERQEIAGEKRSEDTVGRLSFPRFDRAQPLVLIVSKGLENRLNLVHQPDAAVRTDELSRARQILLGDLQDFLDLLLFVVDEPAEYCQFLAPVWVGGIRVVEVIEHAGELLPRDVVGSEILRVLSEKKPPLAGLDVANVSVNLMELLDHIARRLERIALHFPLVPLIPGIAPEPEQQNEPDGQGNERQAALELRSSHHRKGISRRKDSHVCRGTREG